MADESLLCGAEGCNFKGRLYEVSKDGNSVTRSRCDRCAARLRAEGYTAKLAVQSAPKPKWDLTSTNSLEAAAGWWLKNADATLLLVIRKDDAVIAVADDVPAAEVKLAIDARLWEAVERLDTKQLADRAEKVSQQIASGTNPEERRYA